MFPTSTYHKMSHSIAVIPRCQWVASVQSREQYQPIFWLILMSGGHRRRLRSKLMSRTPHHKRVRIANRMVVDGTGTRSRRMGTQHWRHQRPARAIIGTL